MKHLALTQRLESFYDGKEIRECLDVRWSQFIQELSAESLTLPVNCHIDSYHDEFKIDGLILTGGNDPYSVNDHPLSQQRDTFEFKLLNWAITRNIPIMGVCRGMQIIALHFSGSLKKVAQHAAVKHNLISTDNSIKLSRVNSYHNYSLNNLPDHFECLAKSDDQNIEAIKHSSKKIMGIMWHPEREQPFNKEDLDLFKGFFST